MGIEWAETEVDIDEMESTVSNEVFAVTSVKSESFESSELRCKWL